MSHTNKIYTHQYGSAARCPIRKSTKTRQQRPRAQQAKKEGFPIGVQYSCSADKSTAHTVEYHVVVEDEKELPRRNEEESSRTDPDIE